MSAHRMGETLRRHEAEAIYNDTCKAKHWHPNNRESLGWQRVLGGYVAQDVRTALDAWFKIHTTRTGRPGRPRRAFPPAPAELQVIVKPLAKSPVSSAVKPVDSKRMAPRGELMFLVSWICGKCRYRASNVIAAGTDTQPLICKWCNCAMKEFRREPAQP